MPKKRQLYNKPTDDCDDCPGNGADHNLPIYREVALQECHEGYVPGNGDQPVTQSAHKKNRKKRQGNNTAFIHWASKMQPPRRETKISFLFADVPKLPENFFLSFSCHLISLTIALI